MDNFIDLAMRTASGGFYGEKVSASVLEGYLQQMVVLGRDLDGIKKSLFYGRAPELLAERWDDRDPPVTDERIPVDVLHGVLGVITEAAEMAEFLLAGMVGQTLDLHNLHEESGDVKWYLAMLARARGDTWDSDEQTVIAKLKKRYPDRFDEEKAEKRDLDGEREIIERKA
jgi:NTP pyrophosphatase (non-canonical NTP hydrolase)